MGFNAVYENLHSHIDVKKLVSTKEIEVIKNQSKEIIKTTDFTTETWKLEIPAIGLMAPISEGTTQEVMRDYVGHFENTNVWSGNIGLAAHNRRISN